MVSSINTNIAAYYAQANIGIASNSASASVQRLSSGNRIVKASDDVAALATGTSLRTQVSALKAALINSSQGTTLLQIADGSLSQITDILQRQKAIAVQAGAGSLDAAARGFLDQEFQALAQEIDRIANSTNFNGVTLLAGGLGTKTKLVNTDALAALIDPTTADNDNASAASEVAIQAFDKRDGTSLADATAGPGQLDLVDATGTTVLVDGAFESVNSAVYGQFSSFTISDVVYDVSAQVTAVINGVEFTGVYADGDTEVTVRNGNTRLYLGVTAFDLSDDGTVQTSEAQLNLDFQNTVIMRSATVQGVNFEGTRLEDTIGDGALGIAAVRLADPTRADIGNFAYVSNAGADANVLSVQVNGRTFTASGVADAGFADGAVIVFEGGNGETLIINLTGLSADDNTDVADIRQNLGDRQAVIDALNTGFSRAGSGLNFAVGATAADNLRVQITSATTVSLYQGQTLSVGSASDAAAASAALDLATKTATSIRATVGALQSRFNFASANIQTSIQNQDAARGELLDTDIASESTSYATSQVKLQAGISVLAQANQQLQSLLKLIG